MQGSSTPTIVQRRKHRISLPIIGSAGESWTDAGSQHLKRIAEGPSNSTLAKAEYKLSRAHRASIGSVYYTTEVVWSVDDNDSEDSDDGDGGEDYEFPWWWFLVMPLEAVPCKR